jgi:uncharacterized protein YegP (UPF0339 family)
MSAFVISQKENGKYKYTFEHRRGKTLLTSMEYYSKEAIQGTILFLQANFESISFYRFKTPAGKFFLNLPLKIIFMLPAENLILSSALKKE